MPNLLPEGFVPPTKTAYLYTTIEFRNDGGPGTIDHSSEPPQKAKKVRPGRNARWREHRIRLMQEALEQFRVGGM